MTSLASGAARMRPIVSSFSLPDDPRTLAHADGMPRTQMAMLNFELASKRDFGLRNNLPSAIVRGYLPARASPARSMCMRRSSTGIPNAAAQTNAVEATSFR